MSVKSYVLLGIAAFTLNGAAFAQPLSVSRPTGSARSASEVAIDVTAQAGNGPAESTQALANARKAWGWARRREALPDYIVACNGGVAEGCLMAQAIRSSIAGDDASIKRLRYASACDGGAAEGCFDVGTLCSDARPSDLSCAAQYFGRAAQLFALRCGGGEGLACTYREIAEKNERYHAIELPAREAAQERQLAEEAATLQWSPKTDVSGSQSCLRSATETTNRGGLVFRDRNDHVGRVTPSSWNLFIQNSCSTSRKYIIQESTLLGSTEKEVSIAPNAIHRWRCSEHLGTNTLGQTVTAGRGCSR